MGKPFLCQESKQPRRYYSRWSAVASSMRVVNEVSEVALIPATLNIDASLDPRLTDSGPGKTIPAMLGIIPTHCVTALLHIVPAQFLLNIRGDFVFVEAQLGVNRVRVACSVLCAALNVGHLVSADPVEVAPAVDTVGVPARAYCLGRVAKDCKNCKDGGGAAAMLRHELHHFDSGG